MESKPQLWEIVTGNVKFYILSFTACPKSIQFFVCFVCLRYHLPDLGDLFTHITSNSTLFSQRLSLPYNLIIQTHVHEPGLVSFIAKHCALRNQIFASETYIFDSNINRGGSHTFMYVHIKLVSLQFHFYLGFNFQLMVTNLYNVVIFPSSEQLVFPKVYIFETLAYRLPIFFLQYSMLQRWELGLPSPNYDLFVICLTHYPLTTP